MSKTLQLKIITALQDKLSAPLARIRGASGASAKSMKELSDKLKGLERTQKELGQFNELKNGLKNTGHAVQDARSKFNELSRAFANAKQAGQPVKELGTQLKKAETRLNGLSNELTSGTQKLLVLKNRLTESGVSTRDFSKSEQDLKSKIEQTNAALEKQKNALGKVKKQQRELSEARQKMERVQSMAGSMAATGAAGLGVGYGVKSLGEKFLAPGISYGAQISELQAVARLKKDDARLDMLKAQARDLGATTAFSATEVAAGQTFLARAGFTPEAINSSMRDMLELALANGTDLARTADIASNISSAFKIDPEVEGNMRRVTDTLSAVSARANVDLEMLGDTMKYLGQAEGLDMTLEEAAAMAGLLGNIGIQGSQAGTTMRAMLNRLSAPAKEGAKAMKMLGLDVVDANGNMKKMPEILSSVAKATEKMGNAERASYFKEIFGVEAGSGMAELIKQQGMGAVVKLIEELEKAQGENRQMALTRADNIDGDLKGFFSAWEEVGIGITDINEGPLRELIQRLTGTVRSVGEWMQKNPELVATIAKVIAVVGGLAAVGGVLMMTLASILGPLAMMRYGMAMLSIKGGGLFSTLWGLGAKALPFLIGAVKALTAVVIANPIGATIAAIAIAALLIWKYWGPIKEFFAGLWRQIKLAFDGGIAGITALLVNWSPLGLVHTAFSTMLSYLGIDVPSKLSEAGSQLLLGFGTAVMSSASNLWAEIKQAFDGGIFSVSALIINWSPIGLFYQAFAAVLDYLGFELPGKFTEFGSMMMSGLVNGIKSMAGSVKESVVGIGESTMGWFKEKLGIQSPSRVFMGFGENISEGAAIGINNRSDLAVKAAQALTAGVLAMSAVSPAQSVALDPEVNRFASIAEKQVDLQQISLPPLPDVANLIDVGAPVVNVAAPVIHFSQPDVDFENIRFDNRPPITTQQVNQQTSYQQSSQYQSNAGDKVEIHIHAAPGQKEMDIARAVAAELDRRERERQAQRRSGLSDY